MPFWRGRRAPLTQAHQTSHHGSSIAAGRDVSVTIHQATPTPTPIEAAPTPLDRLVEMYRYHDVRREELPAFLRQVGGIDITLAEAMDDERLWAHLDDDLIGLTARLFRAEERWLLTGEGPILRAPSSSSTFDKRPKQVADYLLRDAVTRNSWDDLYAPAGDRIEGSLWVFADEALDFSPTDSGSVQVGMIYKVPIVAFKGRYIYRYLPLGVVPWDYGRTRYELVTAWTIADEVDCNVWGKYVEREDLFAYCHGRRLFPDWKLGGHLRKDFDVHFPSTQHFLWEHEGEGGKWYRETLGSYMEWMRTNGLLDQIWKAKTQRQEMLAAMGEWQPTLYD